MIHRSATATLIALSLCLNTTAQETAATLDQMPEKVFFYNPGARQGLMAAWVDKDGSTGLIGQVFSSDYARWGSEKRMYDPFITALPTGGYASVFAVNDYSPCFAVTYSDDLVVWRPQDYPRMSVQGCLKPVIRYDGDSRYTVLFRTRDGRVRKCSTDASFRRFSADTEAGIEEYELAARSTDVIEVDGKAQEGLLIEADAGIVRGLREHFASIAESGVRNAEKLSDDPVRFAALEGRPFRAVLSIMPDRSKSISDKLIGIFFEDISYAADGGLYAELVQNRDFEYSPEDRSGWGPATAWTSSSGTLRTGTENPLGVHNPHYATVADETIVNSGWDGIKVDRGEKYDFSCCARLRSGRSKSFRISLVDGDRVLASTTLRLKAGKGGSWTCIRGELTARASSPAAELHIEAKGRNEADMDMISLFPRNTFKGRANGLRTDLAQAIADLRPKFVRFPGGCMSHGDGLDNIYRWKHSIGPLHERVPDRNIWQYHQTKGLGFYEYFQFCEDICAEPLPVLAAGVPCQNSDADAEGFGGQQGGIPMEDMPAYIDEILDLIEWANGDPEQSAMARMRAEAGHPEPFNLKYIGIGNEDIISTVFEDRYLMICKAVKERYPDITVCGTAGPFHAPSSDYIEGWRFAEEHRDVIDMVDEHYYESVGWFLNNAHYYDGYDRSAPQVYLGEYAAREGSGGLDCALAEAYHLCNVERNADIVAMTSYAPLFSKDGHSNWSPDLIYFDNAEIRLSASYHTQRLFSVYSGNSYIPSSLSCSDDSADALRRIAASVVTDEQGNAYLKIVNVLPVALDLEVDTGGLEHSSVLFYEGIEGQPGQTGVQTAGGEYRVEGDGRFRILLPPYSFRAIRLG